MTEPHRSTADQFASEHLATVLHVASLLTGSSVQAEDITVAAWQRLATDPQGDETRQVRQLYAELLRAWRRTRRSPVDRARGPLELHDLRPQSAAATTTSPSAGSIIRDGLRALTDGERSVLVLHVVAGVDMQDVSRIVRRPARIVQRDLATSLEFLADASGTRTDQITARVRTALAPDHRAAVHAAALAPRLQAALAGSARTTRRPRAVLVAGAAAGTAAVLVAAFLVGRSGEPDQTARREAAAPAIELPGPAAGLKLVGFQQIMVTVPEDWVQETPLCINVDSSSVLYPMDDELPPCIEAVAPGNSVSFGRYDAIDDDVTFAREHRVLLNEVLMLSNVIRRDGAFVQYAALEKANVAVAVQASRRAGLAMVLSSIQELPSGYAVVPSCLKLNPEDATGLLADQGLRGRIFEDPSSHATNPPQHVVTQTPLVGTVLPFDATVNLGAVPR